MSRIIEEVSQHYEMWNQDNEKRRTRYNGWNAITDAYWGKLPNDWPYITRMVDPRLRTTLIEKNARLLNNKLRGRLVPREGGDTIKANLNNAILDFQWDSANDGGSMLTKLGIADIDSRLYQSKFALVPWKYEIDKDGKCIFDGNELYPLDIRNCGMDSSASCTHIRNAKWFQVRTYEYIEDLESQMDVSGKPMFKNLGELKMKLAEKVTKQASTRKTDFVPRGLQLRGLEDRTGEDRAYPIATIVTEYRKDRWITFVPEHKLILRDIKNPYKHGKIPIAQLRYYPIQDDPLGESEVEPVMDLWLAIQATICAYMDEVILKIRPPLKIIENQARIETIVYGPEAQWLVDSVDAITEMKSSGDALAYFQTTYQVLVSAFNIAMGDLSQGTSNFDPFETNDKTATEIRATTRQQNTRDQKNQNDLGEFLKDVMSMWLSNNQQFLLGDPSKKEYVIKIVGEDQYAAFKRSGLGDMEVTPEAEQMIADIISESGGEISDEQLMTMYESAGTPKYPVFENPNEKDPTKLVAKPKMREGQGEADISVVPSDLEGTYDYIPDVKSMAAGAADELMQARQRAIDRFTSNPVVLQLLMEQGWRPNVKELLSDDFEDTGLRDAERYFSKIETGIPQAGAGQNVGPGQDPSQPGLPALPGANPQAGGQQVVGPQPAGPTGASLVPNVGGIS